MVTNSFMENFNILLSTNVVSFCVSMVLHISSTAMVAFETARRVSPILVQGYDEQEHNSRLRVLFERAKSIILKLNKAKCILAKSEVNYVGHLLTGEGLKPTPERVSAIREIREPENHAELETILGMLAYAVKFIPHLSELNAPLRALKINDEWKWTSEAKQSFDNVKKHFPQLSSKIF